jgi:hypothetical protein
MDEAHRRHAALAVVTAVVVACGPAAGEDVATTPPPDPGATSAPIVFDRELHDELLAMGALDQAVRGGPVPPGVDPAALLIDRVDLDNRTRLAEIFDEHGWPGWSLVGEDGSTAAWQVVQHADLDLAFQQRGLELLSSAVEEGDASPGDLAYLVDRVQVAMGEPQTYGTQWQLDESGMWEPRTPIAEEESVDERRRAAGLSTLDEYLSELDAAAG